MVKGRVLFVVAHRLGRSPGQRFRFEQYLDYLKSNGFDYEISYFLNEKDDRIFYSKGNYLDKFLILLKSFFQRLEDAFKARDYDIVFIYRDAIMVRTTIFERLFRFSGAKIIFDFDDALWLTEVSEGNANLGWLKDPQKTKTIIRLSDLVFAGNEYLAEYARRYNNNVKVVPTTIDTDNFKRKQVVKPEGKICIGWTGSSTTVKHLKQAKPVLRRIKEKFGERVYFMMISDMPMIDEDLQIKFCRWRKETETDDLSLADIGIMPLPDDEWAKGKCGFKGLQYMALEIPSVMSPVGVNNDIIRHGVNGFLPGTEDEWVETLTMLIEDAHLREKIGKAGRQTVVERYSLESQKDKYMEYYRSLIVS